MDHDHGNHEQDPPLVKSMSSQNPFFPIWEVTHVDSERGGGSS